MGAADEQLEQVKEIAEVPLRFLERRFNELSAAMSASGDHAETMAGEAVTDDEKIVQWGISLHSRGIASGLELAATEISKARDELVKAYEEMKEGL